MPDDEEKEEPTPHIWPTLPTSGPIKRKPPGRVPTATDTRRVNNRNRMRAKRAADKGAQ